MKGRGGGTMFRLRLPTGSRAIVENPIEKEVTVAAGQRYRVAEIVEGVAEGAHSMYSGPARIVVLEAIGGGAP